MAVIRTAFRAGAKSQRKAAGHGSRLAFPRPSRILSLAMVSSDRSKVLAAAGLAPALFLGLMLLSQLWNSHCSFREAAPNVFVCKQRLFSYELQNVLLRVPTRQGIWPLKRLVNRWVLVDAGAPNTWLFGAHGRGLTKAVLAKLRPAKRGDASGQLDLIIGKLMRLACHSCA